MGKDSNGDESMTKHNGNGNSNKGGRKKGNPMSPIYKKIRAVLADMKEKNAWTQDDMARILNNYRLARYPHLSEAEKAELEVKKMVIFDYLKDDGTQFTMEMVDEISKAFSIPLRDLFPEGDWNWTPSLPEKLAIYVSGLTDEQLSTVTFIAQKFYEANLREQPSEPDIVDNSESKQEKIPVVS